MVLQLTDFTSEITDEELREFTSEYYIPFALHPVVPAASASIADFPEGKVGGTLPRDERPPPGSYIIIISKAPRKCRRGETGQGGAVFLPPSAKLSKPKLVTEGMRPLRDGEEPLLESATVEPPGPDATSVGSSEDADVAGAESEAGEVNSGLFGSTSTEEETPDSPPALATKEVTETPPPNVEATRGSSAPVTHAVRSPPQTSPKVFEGMPVDQLMEEFDMVTAQQAALVAQLRARFSRERSQTVQKDEEILLLKTQLADAQAEAESSRSYAQKLAEEKMALLVKVEQERANSADYKASCHWAVKYLEGGKNNHFSGLDEFRQRVEELVRREQREVTQTQWLISHGLLLAAMSTFENRRRSSIPLVPAAQACHEGAEPQPELSQAGLAQLAVFRSLPVCVTILDPFALERRFPHIPVLMEHQLSWRLCYLKIVTTVKLEEAGRYAHKLAGQSKVVVTIVAYKLELPQENSNFKKCYADEPLAVPLDGLHIDDKLHFVEEPVEIMDHEVKRLRQRRVPIVMV
ncbi:hypothetical protein Tco_0437829 [Tanacetum coccineum]